MEMASSRLTSFKVSFKEQILVVVVNRKRKRVLLPPQTPKTNCGRI
jgi:hypothetical protein